MIIRFWVFVLVLTVVTFVLGRLLGYGWSLLRVFLFWLVVALLSVAALYLFSLMVSTI